VAFSFALHLLNIAVDTEVVQFGCTEKFLKGLSASCSTQPFLAEASDDT
jgi:hypothetical protein